jgi:transcriptional regulator with XRE-family HTH domain
MKEVTRLVGTNVRKYRVKQGFTQERLADRVSLSSDYLSRLELGKENPTVDVLHRISSALGVSITTLFHMDDSSD